MSKIEPKYSTYKFKEMVKDVFDLYVYGYMDEYTIELEDNYDEECPCGYVICNYYYIDNKDYKIPVTIDDRGDIVIDLGDAGTCFVDAGGFYSWLWITDMYDTDKKIKALTSELEAERKAKEEAIRLLRDITEWDGILPHSMKRIKDTIHSVSKGEK